MLSNVRKVGARRLRPWRAYATVQKQDADDELAEQVMSSTQFRAKPKRTNDVFARQSTATHTVFVRCLDRILAPSDSYSILRGIERKYGPVREYRILRDTEISSVYQSILWANFASTDSFNLVPTSGEVLDIRAPEVNLKKEGGQGLDDLQGLLDSEVKQEEDVPETPAFGESVTKAQKQDMTRTFQVRVERAVKDQSIKYEGYRTDLNRDNKAVGYAFMQWGGFAPLKPLYTSSPYTSPSQETPPETDSHSMRLALNKWSEITGQPDPSFSELKTDVIEQNVEVEQEVDLEAEIEQNVEQEVNAEKSVGQEVKAAKKVKARPKPQIKPEEESLSFKLQQKRNVTAVDSTPKGSESKKNTKTDDAPLGEEEKARFWKIIGKWF